jgi:hypothetical protein
MEKKKEVAKTAFTAHLFAVNLLEKLIEVFRGLLTSKLLEFCIKWASRIGHFALIVAAGLGFLFALIFAIRSNSFQGFLFGLAWVVLVFVVQYTAHKFSTAGETLIKNNPSQMSSKIFLDCFAFLVMIGGVVVFILQIVAAVRFGSFYPFLWGLGAFIFLEFVALVAFNPEEATIEIVKDNSAGQEAIGIITFFIKALMRLVPIIFGIGVAIGTVLLFIDFIGLFGSNFGFAWMRGNKTAVTILYAALLPFLSYLYFVLAYLVLDVIRSILSIPGKLDKLGK